MEPPPPTKRLWKLNNLYRLCLKTFEGNKGILDLRGQDQGWQANVVRYILVCHCSDFFIEFLLHFSFANLLSKTAHRSSLEHASILIIYGGKNWGAREVWQPELEEQKEQPRFKPDIWMHVSVRNVLFLARVLRMKNWGQAENENQKFLAISLSWGIKTGG